VKLLRPPTAAEQQNPIAMAMRQVGIPTAPGVDGQSPAKEARYLLRAAAEIEHGLLVQYLYTAYSAKDDAVLVPLVRIAKEEMGHLVCVQNLLMVVGSGPYFDRQAFTAAPGQDFPAPFPLVLAPLSKGRVADFTLAESPLKQILQGADGFTPEEQAANQQALARLQQVGQFTTLQADSIHRVGALYAALFWLFKADDAPPPAAEWAHYPTQLVLDTHRQAGRSSWHLSDSDLVAFAKVQDFLAVQSDNEKWGRTNRIFVRGELYAQGQPDRAAMRQVLSDIAAQGEGWLNQGNSHFQQFLGLFDAFAAANPPAAWDVPTNPVTSSPPGADAPGLIDDPESVLWARLFNTRYWIALMKLSIALALPRSGDNGGAAGRQQLVQDVVHSEMPDKLGVLAKDLVQLRRRPNSAARDAGEKAAAPFELPPGPALPDRLDSQWAALRDWLKLSARLIAQIKALPADPATQTLRGDLDGIADGDAKLLDAIPVPAPA
jgi:rubrerythrin